MASEDLLLVQELSEYGVRVTQDIAQLTVAGGRYRDLQRGSQLSLPMWAAEILIDAGLAEPLEGRIDVQRMVQLLWRERRSLTELVELPPKIYHVLRLSTSRPSGVDPETVKTVRLYFKDLVSLRLSKLIGYASKGVDPDLVQRMTDEERELYLRLRDVIGVWLSSLGLEV